MTQNLLEQANQCIPLPFIMFAGSDIYRCTCMHMSEKKKKKLKPPVFVCVKAYEK